MGVSNFQWTPWYKQTNNNDCCKTNLQSSRPLSCPLMFEFGYLSPNPLSHPLPLLALKRMFLNCQRSITHKLLRSWKVPVVNVGEKYHFATTKNVMWFHFKMPLIYKCGILLCFVTCQHYLANFLPQSQQSMATTECSCGRNCSKGNSPKQWPAVKVALGSDQSNLSPYVKGGCASLSRKTCKLLKIDILNVEHVKS